MVENTYGIRRTKARFGHLFLQSCSGTVTQKNPA